MRPRMKILGLGLAVLAVGVLSMMVILSRNSACTAPASLPDGTSRMKAITYRCYGSPEVLALEDVAKPTPEDDEVLVRVHAASINPLEWHYMQGKPYVMRLSSGLGKPKDGRLGVDFAGTVEAIGRNVMRFQPGDEI